MKYTSEINIYECPKCKGRFKSLRSLKSHVLKCVRKRAGSQEIFPIGDERYERQVREEQCQAALIFNSSVLKQFPNLSNFVEKTENISVGKNKKETTLRKPDWRKDICDDTHYD